MDADRLDVRIEEGRLKPRHLRAIARELADRHAAAAPCPDRGGEPTALLELARRALSEIRARGSLPDAVCRSLEERVQGALVESLPRMLERHARGRVRDVAGQVPPRAIHVRGRVATLDVTAPASGGTDVAAPLACLSAAVRAFLGDEPAEILLAAYALRSDDYGLYRVIDGLELLAALEGASAEPTAARQWVDPWLRSSRPDGANALIVTVGGVATGKSTLAKALVRRLGAPRIVADKVRAAVLEPVADVAGPKAVLERAWSKEFDQRALAALLLRARDVLKSGRSCIIDSCSAFRRYRDRFAELALEEGATLLLCSCIASPERVAERLAARDARDGVATGDWAEIARRLGGPFEAVSGEEPGRHLLVDTDAPVSVGVTIVEAALRPSRRTSEPARSGFPAAVTFDCWNTLLTERDWPKAHALRVDALCAAVEEDGARLERALVAEAFDAAWLKHMELWREGVVSGAREVARWSLEHLRLPLPEAVVEHLTARFQEASHTGQVVALDGARETLETLADAGVRMALVCDTGLTPGRVVRKHLDRVGLLSSLDIEVFSDEAGIPKPDPRIFRTALQALSVDPADAVHVGDLLRTDVAGARGVGMGSIRLASAHDDAGEPHPEADAVADNHRDLPALLAAWRERPLRR